MAVRMANAVLWALPLLLAAFAARAENICHRGGGNDVSIILQYSEDIRPIRLTIDRRYFDQRFIPQNDSVVRAKVLDLQATDFAPWPEGLRAHMSEGPYLSLLIATANDLELVAQRFTSMTLGYRLTDTVQWRDTDGPFGLKRLGAPPPSDPLTGGFFGRDDVYIARDTQGAVTDVIRCKRLGDTPFQTCNHLVEAGVADLKLLYALDYLPDWHRLSREARAFYSCIRDN